MKALLLFTLAALFCPLYAFAAIGARRESWPILTAAGALLAALYAGAKFLTGG